MRLYDTYSRSLVELPAAPGPVRMYFCGPTVYARAHIGNARPFVVGMWLRSWLRATGYDAQLVHNITDINDKIYDAAPGASAELAARATEWYLEDTADLGLGMPDRLPKATDSVPQIVQFIEELVEADVAFHAVIARATGNAVLTSLLASLSTRTMRVRLWRGRRVDNALDVTRDEHRRIYEAIVAGDPELARAAATAHIASGERWLRSQLADGDAVETRNQKP